MRINLGIRRRLAPLLSNHRKRIELLNSLLFSMPGTPVIYYGDEIGMGDNIYVGDRNGVRTPMQWSADRNAGFSRANPQKLYLPVIIDPEYHYEAVNVEAQQGNPRSLLWWMKRLIAMRKRYKALGQGDIHFLQPENRKILAFLRAAGEETLLVVANLSRFVQYVELDLSELRERVPVELFGETEFPPVGDSPYFLSLGPHSVYWFAMESPAALRGTVEIRDRDAEPPLVPVAGKWERLLSGKGASKKLEEALPAYLRGRRWFGGKARRIKSARIQEVLPLANTSRAVYILLVNVGYTEGSEETYTVPITYASGDRAAERLQENPRAVLARITVKDKGEEGLLYDALWDETCRSALLAAILSRRRRKGSAGDLVGRPMPGLRRTEDAAGRPLESTLLTAEQSNSSVAYGDRYILKLFRRLDQGVNPDLEIGRFLTARGFPHTPPVKGFLEYHRDRKDPMTLAVLQGFEPNEGDAWEYTRDHLEHYFENALAEQNREDRPEIPPAAWVDLDGGDPPAFVFETIGPYLESARLLGVRTADMHQALASDPDDPAFAPEPFTKLYQRSLYQSMRSLTGWVFPLLANRLSELPHISQRLARPVLAEERRLRSRFRSFADRKFKTARIRCHGDYHLGQVLFTGKDFMVLDFEGEPARPLSERRIKRCPLRDVAGMLRSFQYASYASLFSLEGKGWASEEDGPEFWARFWNGWVAKVFLSAYLEAATPGGFLPDSREQLRDLLEFYLLEKAIYELGYELNNRPDWVRIPLQGLHDLIQ
jgi:maltose alpha-D-glucosyltransferase/alpha-amylase